MRGGGEREGGVVKKFSHLLGLSDRNEGVLTLRGESFGLSPNHLELLHLLFELNADRSPLLF